MKSFNQWLHDCWFESAPATRLALLRILVGLFTIWYLVPELDDFVKVARSDPRLFDPVGVVFGNTPISVELFEWVLRATLFSAFCFTFGLWHRITGPAFAGLALWVFCYRNSWSMIYHSDNLVVLHVIVLGFTRSADALSLDALFRGRRSGNVGATAPSGWQYGWPVKLICAVTVSTYFVTALAKLSGPLGLEWMTGPALRSQMAVDQIRKELLGSAPNALSYAIYEWVPLFSVLAIGSLLTELLAPLALFNRRLGRMWAINAFLMHLGIWFVMHITFHYQMTGVMFASFFPLERLQELPRKLWPRRAAVKPPALPAASSGLTTGPSVPRATL